MSQALESICFFKARGKNYFFDLYRGVLRLFPRSLAGFGRIKLALPIDIVRASTRRFMLKNFLTLMIFCSALSFGLSLPAAEKSLNLFEQDAVGAYPKKAKTYPFRKKKAKAIYQVAKENGQKYLQGVDDGTLATPVFFPMKVDLNQYPYLKFQWRAQTLPEGARETPQGPNDSACGVYTLFGSRLSGKAIKYVWSNEMPLGHTYEKKPKRFVIAVKERGFEKVGSWQEVSVDIKAGYEKFFKKSAPDQMSGIGMLTEGNSTKKRSACDYGNFRLSSTP